MRDDDSQRIDALAIVLGAITGALCAKGAFTREELDELQASFASVARGVAGEAPEKIWKMVRICVDQIEKAPEPPPADAPGEPDAARSARILNVIRRLPIKIVRDDLDLQIAIRYSPNGPNGPVRKVTVSVLGCDHEHFQTVTHVIGWCHYRNGPRFFLADRIAELTDLETGEIVANPEEWLRRKAGIHHGFPVGEAGDRGA